MNKTAIEWCDYTWNPVTGCQRQCTYCYAAKIWRRFNKTPFTDITLHPERLKEPLSLKKPATIFVGSMSDIYYWSEYEKREVVNVARMCPQHTFMFLSKSPHSYEDITWPQNCMQGLTLEKMNTIEEHFWVKEILEEYPRPFLSIEPLLGRVEKRIDECEVETIIVGAMTGPGAIKPEKEWVQTVLTNIPKKKLFLKDSMKRCIKAYGLQ